MSDNEDFAKEFEADINDDHKPTPEETPEKTPEAPDSPTEPKKTEAEEPEKKANDTDKPTDDGEGVEKPKDEADESGKTPEAEAESDGKEDDPKDDKPADQPPITEDAIRKIVEETRTSDRNSTAEVEEAINEVLEAYYPNGVPDNVLRDEATGKELRTPQDVVDLTNGEMSIEKAQQWLVNKQFELDKDVSEIKGRAKEIAETTLKFKNDATTVIRKYEPLFKEYPQLQQKTWDAYKKLIKTDKDDNFVLEAPDMQEFYDLVLDAPRMAFERSNQKSATAATPEPEKPAEPPKPTADDRLDVTGDGGSSEQVDPNDFAANVKQELAKGF